MDKDEEREMPHQITDHALRLAETPSFPHDTPRRAAVPQHCVSLIQL